MHLSLFCLIENGYVKDVSSKMQLLKLMWPDLYIRTMLGDT